MNQRNLKQRNDLVTANLGLVYRIADSFRLPRSTALYEDAIADGSEALVKAAERFDATRGFTFSSYAWSWIAPAIKATLCRQSVVHVPTKLASRRATAGEQVAAPEFSTCSYADGLGMPLPEALTDTDAVTRLEDADELARLQDTVAALPEHYRDVVEWHFSKREPSTAEYSRQTGVSRWTAGQRLNEALDIIRAELADDKDFSGSNS